MADGQITGGVVRLLERMKTGDYEHKESMVELHFNVFEGQDYRDLLDRCQAEVIEQTGRMLGRTKKAVVEQTRATRRPPRIEVEVHAENATVEQAGAAIESKAAEVPANKAVVTTNDPEAEAQTERLLQAAADPLDLGDASTGSSGISPTDGSTEIDPLDMMPAAPEVTDKMLGDQVQFHNNRLIEAAKKSSGTDDGSAGTLVLRRLIGKYVPTGKKLPSISQDQRQNFLDDLKGLKA